MSVPTELPDIGSTGQRLRQNPRFDPVAAGVGPEEYFVWTRFDGATTLRDLILMTGLPTPKAVDIVRKLRMVGAILLPNERPETVAARLPPRAGTLPQRAAPPTRTATPAARFRQDTDAAPTIERGPTAAGASGLGARSAATTDDEDAATTRVAASAIRPPVGPPTSGRASTAPPVGPATSGRPGVAPSPPQAGRARPSASGPPTSGRRASTSAVPLTSGRAPSKDGRSPTGDVGAAAAGAVRGAAFADGPPTSEEAAALAEDIDLTMDERTRILAMYRLTRTGDTASVLGITDPSDKKAAKRAYFVLSKEFHPDRFYGKRTGSFATRLSEIFDTVAKAYAELTDDRPRRATSASSASMSTAQSPTDYAAELFDRACQSEVSGDLPAALRLFESALRIDAPARYLRRAARCALHAREPRLALDYAKKAAALEPNDPSTARLLAHAYKAGAKYAEAEEVLVFALMIKTENDQLTSELQSDLAEVRRLAAR